MLYKLLLAVAVTVAISPLAKCISLHEVAKEDTPNLNAIKQEFVQKHPELVHWFERAMNRLKARKNASQEDIQEVRQNLDNIREHVYEFVTSPIFTLTTDVLIDRATSMAAPFLGVLPIKEVRELINIVRKDPTISETLFEENQSLTKLIPGAEELDQWLMNSTHYVLSETVGSMHLSNDTNVTSV